MNKRIKELWEEGTFISWPRPGKFTAGEYDYHLEKFAELIVQECLSIIEKERTGYQAEGGYVGQAREHYEKMDAKETALSDIKYVLQSHFGVDE